jgi:hypothetical protein
MGFWDSLKKDIKKGVDEGLEAFKEGTEAIKHKAGSVTEDIKKKVKSFELKQKIQVQLTELGGRVYEVASDKRRNPMKDKQVTKIVNTISKIESQIAQIESKKTETPKAVSKSTKKSTRKVSRKKNVSRKGTSSKKASSK